MKPHKHAEVIKAWADGAEIEYKDLGGRWREVINPCWNSYTKYRVKPRPAKQPYSQESWRFNWVKFEGNSLQNPSIHAVIELEAEGIWISAAGKPSFLDYEALYQLDYTGAVSLEGPWQPLYR